MKKYNNRPERNELPKLRFQRETVRCLDQPSLKKVVGGAIAWPTVSDQWVNAGVKC